MESQLACCRQGWAGVGSAEGARRTLAARGPPGSVQGAPVCTGDVEFVSTIRFCATSSGPERVRGWGLCLANRHSRSECTVRSPTQRRWRYGTTKHLDVAETLTKTHEPAARDLFPAETGEWVSLVASCSAFHYSGGGQPEASAGTGIFRGGVVTDTDEDAGTWAISTASRGGHVEICVTIEA